jgi:hypothetical protein
LLSNFPAVINPQLAGAGAGDEARRVARQQQRGAEEQTLGFHNLDGAVVAEQAQVGAGDKEPLRRGDEGPRVDARAGHGGEAAGRLVAHEKAFRGADVKAVAMAEKRLRAAVEADVEIVQRRRGARLHARDARVTHEPQPAVRVGRHRLDAIARGAESVILVVVRDDAAGGIDKEQAALLRAEGKEAVADRGAAKHAPAREEIAHVVRHERRLAVLPDAEPRAAHDPRAARRARPYGLHAGLHERRGLRRGHERPALHAPGVRGGERVDLSAAREDRGEAVRG